MDHPFPTKAIHPPIYPGESNWREYYRSRNLNLPQQYHNGGIWPLIGGLHVAALVRRKWESEAVTLLGSLAEANKQGIEGKWEFNEWMHGVSGRPMGYGKQAWSAASYLYAEYAVRCGALPLFNDLVEAKPEASRLAEQNEIIIHPDYIFPPVIQYALCGSLYLGQVRQPPFMVKADVAIAPLGAVYFTD
jgi:hypothetical protein